MTKQGKRNPNDAKGFHGSNQAKWEGAAAGGTAAEMERATGFEPATFSLGS